MTPDGIISGSLHIQDGKIKQISTQAIDIEDAVHIYSENMVVMPGVIDPHVHINEPGRTDWEGFYTATHAAAMGGITTVVDMPLNSLPVTTSVKNYELKCTATADKLWINVGLWGGVVPTNLHEIEELLQAGALGIKAFLTHSGIDEFPNTTEEDLIPVMEILKQHNKPLLVHAELDYPHDGIDLLAKHPTNYSAYLASRPKAWENDAIKLMIDLCRRTGTRVHIVHLSSAEALPMLINARKEGLPISVETGQHYLYFCAEQIPDGNTAYKCAPPIREKANNELLWDALKNGDIDFIATDHSPAPPEIKELESGNFQKAWGGIAGLQFALTSAWTAAKKRGFTLFDITKWLSENPAKFLSLENSKGKLVVGFDADIIIWDPEDTTLITPEIIQHKHKTSPFINETLFGKVYYTFVNGELAFSNGNFAQKPHGIIVKQ